MEQHSGSEISLLRPRSMFFGLHVSGVVAMIAPVPPLGRHPFFACVFDPILSLSLGVGSALVRVQHGFHVREAAPLLQHGLGIETRAVLSSRSIARSRFIYRIAMGDNHLQSRMITPPSFTLERWHISCIKSRLRASKPGAASSICAPMSGANATCAHPRARVC